LFRGVRLALHPKIHRPYDITYSKKTEAGTHAPGTLASSATSAVSSSPTSARGESVPFFLGLPSIEAIGCFRRRFRGETTLNSRSTQFRSGKKRGGYTLTDSQYSTARNELLEKLSRLYTDVITNKQTQPEKTRET